MSKYDVKIDLWGHFQNVEAETEQEAIFKTLTDVISEEGDFMTDYEEIAQRILDTLQNSCYAEESEE